ncbi:hypothetical protein FPV67DRAFT_1552644 [Lyophyllum atratum]|nr:hypothetical protein FPV67DRAFT_1552644 [Lyophyllum atratum]
MSELQGLTKGEPHLFCSTMINILANTNQPPSDAEARAINDLVSQRTADMGNIDLDIRHLQLELDTLKTRRMEWQSDVDSYKSLLSAKRRLPQEILAEIFSHMSCQSDTGPVRPLRRAAPLSLCHVSSAWRQAALSSPSLWNTLALDIEVYHFRESQEPLISIIPSWFANASVLSLRFSLFNHLFSHLSLVSTIITRGVTPLSHRFSELRFEMKRIDELDSFLSLPSGSIPLLQTLVLHIKDIPDVLPPTTVFGGAPKLRNASIGIDFPHIDEVGDPSRFAFPWSQLEELDMKYSISLRGFTQILVQCVHLRTAAITVDLDETFGNEMAPEDIITYEHLQRLTLKLRGSEGRQIVEATLLKLLFPVTQYLEFTVEWRNARFPLIAILTPISANTFIPLCSLILTNVVAGDDELANLLAACTSLEKLALQIPHMPPQRLFDMLLRVVGDVDSRSSLPNIVSFSVAILGKRIEGPYRLAAAFSNLVSSWVTNPLRERPLQSVGLYTCELSSQRRDWSEMLLERVRSGLGPWKHTSRDRRFSTRDSGLVVITCIMDMDFILPEALDWVDSTPLFSPR